MTPARALELLNAHGASLELSQLSDDDARDVLQAYVDCDVDTFADALRAIAYGTTVVGIRENLCERCGAAYAR